MKSGSPIGAASNLDENENELVAQMQHVTDAFLDWNLDEDCEGFFSPLTLILDSLLAFVLEPCGSFFIRFVKI